MKDIRNFFDYILIFMLIAISGINYFYLLKPFITITFILSLLILLSRKIKINISETFFIFILVLLEILQGIFFGNFEIIPIVGLFLRIATAYIIVKILYQSFITKFVNTIIFLSLISLPFFILCYNSQFVDYMLSNVTPFFKPVFEYNNPIYDIHPNVILYTFSAGVIYENIRNSGPFYEPGMFAVFLNFALLLNIIRQKKLINIKNLILIITIITTFSTSGYIAFFLIVAGYFLNFKQIKSIFFFIIISSFALYLYMNISFLSEKVNDNIDAKETTTSRFGSFFADINYIKQSPIIGNSRSLYERIGFSKYDKVQRHRNNGISKLAVNYGLFFLIYFFYLYYKFFKAIKSHYKSEYPIFFGFIVIIVLGFSQIIFQYAFFLSIPFLIHNYNAKQQV